MSTELHESGNRLRTTIVVLLLVIVFLAGLLAYGFAEYRIKDTSLRGIVMVLASAISASVIFALIHWFVLSLCEGSRFNRLYLLTESLSDANRESNNAKLNEIHDRIDNCESNYSEEQSRIMLQLSQIESSLESMLTPERCKVIDRMDFRALFDSLQLGDELWWNDTYAPNWQEWVDRLGPAIQRGAHVRMLVQNPRCKNAIYRGEELGEVKGFKRDLRAFIETVESCRESHNDADGVLEIVSYSGLPCAPLYVVSRVGVPQYGFCSHFLGSATGVRFPHIRMEKDDEYLGHVFNYLRERWKQNRTVVFDENTVATEWSI